MRVIRGVDKKLRRPLCLAVGVFDGVHVGHREVIGRAVKMAAGGNLVPAVLTFDPHPDAVLSSQGAPPLLTTAEEKVALLRNLGVELTILARFDRELADIPAAKFVEEVLVGRLRARCVVVGENWRFGAGGRGGPELLRRMAGGSGFRVTVVPRVLAGGRKVSSTRIRELLAAGRLKQATKLLGRSYGLLGRVVRGEGVGRKLGFPTANLDLSGEKLIPADGVYACRSGQRLLRNAVAYIGRRPTFGEGRERRVEVHLLDRDGRVDLWGRVLRTELVERLRGDRRFSSERALVEQMVRDCWRARVVLDSLQSR